MIRPDGDKKVPYDGETTSGQPSGGSGGSGSDTAENVPHSSPLGPPPDFTPYEAEHFEVGYSDIVSHDPHLNSDGSFVHFVLSLQIIMGGGTLIITRRSALSLSTISSRFYSFSSHFVPWYTHRKTTWMGH